MTAYGPSETLASVQAKLVIGLRSCGSPHSDFDPSPLFDASARAAIGEALVSPNELSSR